MRCNLIFEDWRQTGQADSVYNPLKATVVFEDTEIGREIDDAYQRHGAYPVFRLMPATVEREQGAT